MARFASALNKWLQGADWIPVASAARTTTGNSGTLDAESISVASLKLDVTAASGTSPNLAVTVEESDDGTTWRTVGTFAAKTAVSNEIKSFQIAAPKVRFSWVITGTTPSLTFSIAGTTK